MYVVALTELHGPVEAEATALAADLGITAYEARLSIAPGMPAVVKTTGDKALALDCLGRLRARGHGAVACDASAVVPSSAMTPIRRFRLEDGGLSLSDRPDESLAFSDIHALVAAVHRRHADTTTTTRETQFSMQRALWTGGVAMTKTVSKQARSSVDEREGVLYVFRTQGARPWILREHGTDWSSLPALAATEAENFRAAVALLRQRSSSATFDDRLMTRKTSETTGLSGGGGNATIRSSNEASVDLLAHLIALWAAREAYR